MEVSDRAQEILENLWIQTKEKGKIPDMSVLRDDPAVQELREKGYVVDDNGLRLSEGGAEKGKGCVRRHRLAERLLVDILGMTKSTVHDAGCRFEHALIEGLEEKICVLLGHPRKCPHGRNIPPGRCCGKKLKHLQSAILPMSEMEEGQSGRIAYLHTENREILQKVIAMGALPGTSVVLLQRSPSYVFEVGQTQFAVDREIAEDIQVSVSGEES